VAEALGVKKCGSSWRPLFWINGACAPRRLVAWSNWCVNPQDGRHGEVAELWPVIGCVVISRRDAAFCLELRGWRCGGEKQRRRKKEDGKSEGIDWRFFAGVAKDELQKALCGLEDHQVLRAPCPWSAAW